MIHREIFIFLVFPGKYKTRNLSGQDHFNKCPIKNEKFQNASKFCCSHDNHTKCQRSVGYLLQTFDFVISGVNLNFPSKVALKSRL
jgi:hypothetical protein